MHAKIKIAKISKKMISLIIVFVLLSAIYTFYCTSMWQNAVTYSKDSGAAAVARADVGKFLSENLHNNETAIVAIPNVYYVLYPDLRGKLVDYASIWNLAGVEIGQRANQEDVLKVRNYFINFLKANQNVKYAVNDPGNPYSAFLFNAANYDELISILNEVKNYTYTLSTGWSSKLTIYQRAQYHLSFNINFSSIQTNYSVAPSDTSVQFFNNSISIEKETSKVGFYIPISDTAIDTSKSNLLSVEMKSSCQNSQFTFVFYYDKNKDGSFSGYGVDYAKSIVLNQTKLGLTAGSLCNLYLPIPSSDYKVVQIAIIIAGDQNGTINLSNLQVFES
ncbi:MAG: hypothetical protein ABR909_09300 [Candidatus Bathyarchaeia archaeon]|jgi:hypothetical protein